jgi:hypothetical protein
MEALLHDKLKEGSTELANILVPMKTSIDAPSNPLSSIAISEMLAKAPLLTDTEYNALLYYLQHTGRPYRSCYDMPHPLNSNILPPRAERPLQVHRGECTFSCQSSHLGNSAVLFHNPLTRTQGTGFIQSIWALPLEASKCTFFIVRPHQCLPPLEDTKAPFSHYSGFETCIVDAQPSDELLIVEPAHIITHLTIFRRPVGTYGIDRDTLVVCWALNRGRR